MARPSPDRIVIDDLTGGRNDTDPPMGLRANQATEFLNMDWKDTRFGRKRGGAAAVTESGGTAFSSGLQTLIRHVPGAAETAAELWGIDGAATPIAKRMAGATTFGDVTVDDAIATKPQDVVAVSHNGKLFLAYDSSVDRLHVYDPRLGTLEQSQVTNSLGGEALRVGAANNVKLAQSFTAGASGTLPFVHLQLLKDNSPQGVVYVTIETDNSDAPSGTQVGGSASSSTLDTSLITSLARWYTFRFATAPTLVSATKYWIVLQGDYAVSGSIFVRWAGKKASSGYANGRASQFDATNWSSTPTSNDVYDFVFATFVGSPRVRRVGFATSLVAPTAANTGSGSYGAVLRYYRTRYAQYDGATLIRRSEASPSVSFTPSGTGTDAVVTRPTVPGEGETHWEVEASTDNATWTVLAGGASSSLDTALSIATTSYNDNRATTTYSTGEIADVAGLHSRLPSMKYLLGDGNRLLGAGAWETTGADSAGRNSRVWFTPVLGDADKGDDERAPNQTNQKNWVDLNENDGGGITGLGGPLYGVPFAFKYRQVWRLTPTGDVATPYLPKKLRDDIGCIAHKTIAVGEDQHGQPALYFLSHKGPYRVTVDSGIQFLGRDNQVTWRSINLAATSVVAHAVYYPDLHQYWVWIATGSANTPDVKMIFDVQLGFPDENGQVRGGWAKHTSSSAAAQCSTLMSNTLAASMSRDLKPYIGRGSGTVIWKCDTSDLDDAGTDFQAYMDSRPVLTTGQLGRKIGMFEPYLLAKALSGVTLTLTTLRGFGLESRTHTALLTAAASETRVFKKFEGAEVGEADVLQVRLGDGSAQEGAWSVDALIVPTQTQEWT